jgi:hypothetical protein
MAVLIEAQYAMATVPISSVRFGHARRTGLMLSTTTGKGKQGGIAAVLIRPGEL